MDEISRDVQNIKGLTTWPLSNRSSSGSAYLARLAVKTTTSKAAPTAAMKASMCGRFNTYTSTTCGQNEHHARIEDNPWVAMSVSPDCVGQKQR